MLSFAEDQVPEDQQQFIALNAELAKSPNWKIITAKKTTPDDAAEWALVKEKFHLLDRNGV